MSNANPYRAAGTFEGVSYIERDADRDLFQQIQRNQRYPYILAPRQSGKSSLLSNTTGKLDPNKFACIFIDVSTFSLDELSSYNKFLHSFIKAIEEVGNFSSPEIDEEILKPSGLCETSNLSGYLKNISSRSNKRIIIFIDEIDRLLSLSFKDDFFSLIRSFFNKRSRDEDFHKIQFVLSGAAQATQLISNKNISPFNIGEKIILRDLSLEQVSQMCQHLYGKSWKVSRNIASAIHRYTKGSVYLTQLILEKLWEMSVEQNLPKIDLRLIKKIVKVIVNESVENIHFQNIYTGLKNTPNLIQYFFDLKSGMPIDKQSSEYLQLKIIGITSDDSSYRNLIYEYVFGADGPLDIEPESIDLSNLQLQSIPEEVIHNKRLKFLRASNNDLTTLPAGFESLLNLIELELSSNSLSTIPSNIGELSNLRKLNLSQNELTVIPFTIGQLSNLEELDISNNLLASIPTEIAQLKKLKILKIHNNPLASPPSEIVALGTKAILDYLREVLKTDRRQWFCKLLVVGEGGVGKTSLLRSLQGYTFSSHESTTHGIEVGSLHLAHPQLSDVTIQINAWDFGGQEIYHATHQFFLTNRSLFLLTWDARLGWEQCKLVYWLKTIRANAPDSPILLVATHIDERDANLPLGELQQQFPQIIGQWETSNLQGTGIEALRQAITNAAAALPLMGERWPTTWLNFANALRNSKQRYATPQQFWGVMTRYKVTPDSQPVLATWLHELGEILFFQANDDLNDIVIFKPQWVTEYISRVLEAEEVIRRNGIFTRTCMEQLWKDLDAPMRDHFLRLMERFDLSYRTLENKDISLIVERLPFEPPAYEPIWDAIQLEPNCKEISMKFQLSEVLPGIPTWFIARQHRFTIDQGERRGIHWRTGVLFQDREQKHLALTKIGRDDRTNAEYLQLTVRGAMPHSFFDLLKEGIELTLRRYPGLQITRLIPCPDPTHVGCTHEFDYANLIKRLERTPPKEAIECPSCLENISVTRLLFGLHWTTQDAVLARLDKIQDGRFELRELVQSQFLRQFRQQQKFLESHCPNVFVLRPDDRSRLKKVWEQEIGTQRMYLQLYCQMPGCMHPTLDPHDPQKPCGLYPIDEPQKWLKVISPYYRRMVGVLKFATPLIGPWLGVMEAKDYEAIFKSDIDLAKELTSKLPALKGGDLDDIVALGGDDRHPETLDGSALRALRQLLEQKDTSKQWGNLKQILTPEGDYLWLCDHHARSFNP